MNKITFEDLPNTQTPVDASNLNTMQTNIETEINKKINFIHLLTVDSVAPEECSNGDKYYNTTNELIYTSTGTDTWGTVGTIPDEDCLYIDDTNKALYIYNGTNLENYGAAATDDLTSTSVNPASVDAVNTAISDLDNNIDQVSDDLTQFSNNCGFVDSSVTNTFNGFQITWKIRKWNNGFCEIWGSSTMTVNMNQTYGYSIYSLVQGVPLPITLIDAYKVQIDTFAASQIYYTTIQAYTNNTFSFFIAKPDTSQTGNQSVGFGFYIRGNWK